MPIRQGKDSHGKYYQWGNQKRYYWSTPRTRLIALRKAIRQAKAIFAQYY